MAEYLMRFNTGLPYGSFEIDMDDGLISFRTYIAFMDCGLTKGVFRHQFAGNLSATAQYFQELMEFVFSGRKRGALHQRLFDALHTAVKYFRRPAAPTVRRAESDIVAADKKPGFPTRLRLIPATSADISRPEGPESTS